LTGPRPFIILCAVARKVTRVLPLTYGWEHLPRRASMPLVSEAAGRVFLREPVPGLLLEVEGGFVLVDTGFNGALVRDRALYHRFWGHRPTKVEFSGPGDPLEDAFALVGVDPRDVVAVALSHLHNDHVGGLRHFAGRIPVHVQGKELELAQADPIAAERNAIFRIDFDDPRIDWRLADGDVEIAPGVTALLTAGHTPGHQSFMVELDERAGGGGYVFAFDAADLQENLDREEPVTAAFGGDPRITLPAIRRLKAIAAERGFRLVPGHDPDLWPRFTRELGVAARP
jgi:N-acyl homoserine lactone hydrolase